MIKIENVDVVGWEHAIRGMRNPKNSWDRIDTNMYGAGYVNYDELNERWESNGYMFEVGPNDHKLMFDLAAGGPVHAKYRRMIVVYLDITAPLYWWKEFDTYKVGTVANSCSTMHKIHEKEFTLNDFSCEHLKSEELGMLMDVIDVLNKNRDGYNDTKNKEAYWWQMIQLLPSSYNQKRTVMLNYEVLVGIYKWRKNHKLDEWCEFCSWIESLPYSELITGKSVEEKKSKDIDPDEYVKKLERSMYGVAVK